MITSLQTVVAIFVLCGCCCIPCLRSLTIRVIEKAIDKPPIDDHAVRQALLAVEDPFNDEDASQEDMNTDIHLTYCTMPLSGAVV